ncbi:hypothetical protein [Chryseobacterium chendengshani]|uniref:hypothetical protein n=1 Tax=unclassified Chryseobacterium TaxID=2593645 RepID=UPI001C63D33F|nr:MULTISPECIES: hypothetical protein [unclassified Chryseobacterium]MBW7676366.1 hypothetical protein [Chryseobacterium sp. LJ756]MBW8523739.1 hypothetical protein [Chryseobacterium sp. LJ668]QYK16683.1 hypothetical protein K0U91_00685 [Chryseobacterium sp. LJ668]
MKIQNINTNSNTSNIKKFIFTFILAGLVTSLSSCRCDLVEESEDPEKETNKTLGMNVDSLVLKKM